MSRTAFLDGRVTLFVGDVREQLATMEADSVDCVVTSPPYWGLRDYGTATWEGGDMACDHTPPVDGGRSGNKGHVQTHAGRFAGRDCHRCGATRVDRQIGLERTLGEHLAVMVDVFAAVWRVLKPSGTVFVNYGDCYATTPNGRSAADTKAHGADDRTFRDKPFSTIGPISGEPHAQACDSADKEGSGSPYRGSSSRNRGGGRKGGSSTRTIDSGVGRALEQARGPLTQILASMRSLFDHLPSEDSSIRKAQEQFSSAILDQVPAAMRSLDVLRAALGSTSPESSEQRPEDSRLSHTLSACLSSLRSSALCVRRFSDRLAEASGQPNCTDGTALPSEELALHIQCTVDCCSLLLSCEHIEPQRTGSLGGKRITDGENRGDVDVGGWGARDDSLRWRGGGVLKAKDLCMVPNRLAIALQEAGWWVRSEIVWAKPNPMPESIRDRPATSHEKIFMLTKSARYWYDAPAVRQASAESSEGRWSQDVESQEGSHRANGGTKTNGTMKAVGGPRKKQAETAAAAGAVGASSGRRMAGFNERWDASEKIRASDVASPRHAGHINHTGIEDTLRGYGRNLRNYEPAPVDVWNVATQPFSDAHFATFPPELAERCILAGCPKGGLVLDPFGGAGTTALVALRHHRRAALIELNPAYAEMAQARIEAEWRVQPKAKAVDFGPLFGHQEAAE